jgi:dipeptidyl aminopeptidase/acylaminoacyl peptidase
VARGQTAPAPSPSPQPTPPANDIFLVEMASAKGQLKVGEPKRITTWEGYNNQPLFLPEGRYLLYTSIRADRQADIYRYDLRDGQTLRVTETTKTSEYSPTPAPDGKSFSVIRVEEDGTQRLWMFPLAGQAAPTLILEKIKPVGYHVWIDSQTLMLFILGEPVTMQLVDLKTGRAEIIATNIGRSLHRVPRQRKISFVRKFSEQQWMIQAFDTQTHAISTLIKTLPGSEDYIWTPQGTLLMANGSKLFKWNPAKDAGWQEVADFASAGLKTITRLSVSPKGDRLALVAQRVTAAP